MHPEATHFFMWAMSDRAIPRSYRMMQGFRVNTFSLINNEGKRHFVKFHWIPHLGVHSLVWDEALKLGGQDPDFHRKDLIEAIENKLIRDGTLLSRLFPRRNRMVLTSTFWMHRKYGRKTLSRFALLESWS